METETLVNREHRKRHKWVNNVCVFCGTIKISEWNDKLKWNITQYVDHETGEICRTIACKTNQTILKL